MTIKAIIQTAAYILDLSLNALMPLKSTKGAAKKSKNSPQLGISAIEQVT
jgi:hypothetical protein